MPRLALGLCLVWFFTLFVFRTVLQWKKTGATGIHGFHGGVGSLPWIAGVAVSLGFVLAPMAPLATLQGWTGGALLFVSTPLHFVGAALVLLGNFGALMAQLVMGDSWRIGVDEAETTTLVTEGLFAWVRNPIFSFIGLTMLGLVLLVPNPLSLTAGLLVALGIEAQVRAVEEPHLHRTHGDRYRRYAETVGRFAPGLGLAAGRRR